MASQPSERSISAPLHFPGFSGDWFWNSRYQCWSGFETVPALVWFWNSTSVGLILKQYQCWSDFETVPVLVWFWNSTNVGLILKQYQCWSDFETVPVLVKQYQCWSYPQIINLFLSPRLECLLHLFSSLMHRLFLSPRLECLFLPVLLSYIINRIQRRYSRFFTISSQRRELSPTRTLKWPRRNRVQITCNTSSADHVQVSCYVPGTKGQLSYLVWQSWNRIYLSFILLAESLNRRRRGGNRSTRRKPLATSFRKYYILQPKNPSPKRDSNPHSSIGGRLGKQTC